MPNYQKTTLPMAEESAATETHVVVVEIPMESSEADESLVMAHPLSEISESPGHLLLLKLYQREEDQLSRRIGRAESRLDAAKRDAFRLSSLFFSFHSLFLTILFAASSVSDTHDNRACRNWCLPASLSALASCAIIASLQVRVCEYWRVLRRLQRDRADARALARCVRELRMKGGSFDLSREPLQAGKRAKSSSVEAEWRPLRWVSRNCVTICLLCVAGLLVPACKFMICN